MASPQKAADGLGNRVGIFQCEAGNMADRVLPSLERRPELRTFCHEEDEGAS